MAEMKDAHIVEIPIDEEHQHKLLYAMSTISEAIQDHPLTEISDSPGHLLLLKLWQREEDLFGRRIALKETRMDSIRREIFQLSTFFFVFHGFFLTILFTSWVNSQENTCKKWWIPSLLSLSTSLVLVFLVQVKLYRYWKVCRQLQKEKNDNRALTRCIQELRMKGASFDLSKEPQSGKRMKSSSVEIKWKPITWCTQNLLTICLVCFTGLVFPASKFILCGL
ncbi:RNA polymerase II elongation factor ELL3 isoform 1 [Quillaja saponaria]|uniref:RNA polymerase II elongation factor ELL3 isoform 1 n=1 Tax=Quillaja saponaria TaxID=32244 RepID=A0AAD7LSL4_QUISA|nr:RNA polymerase II elongation factor ELL3 isoform 1 [Quillaja saponaria]